MIRPPVGPPAQAKRMWVFKNGHFQIWSHISGNRRVGFPARRVNEAEPLKRQDDVTAGTLGCNYQSALAFLLLPPPPSTSCQFVCVAPRREAPVYRRNNSKWEFAPRPESEAPLAPT